MVAAERVLSTREVFRELEDSTNDEAQAWLKDRKALFTTPTPEEAMFVGKIFHVPHFQNNIEGKKLMKGGKVADPFVIARAAVKKATVVTVEKFKPNSADIPNICQHFNVPCRSLEEFMQEQGWTF